MEETAQEVSRKEDQAYCLTANERRFVVGMTIGLAALCLTGYGIGISRPVYFTAGLSTGLVFSLLVLAYGRCRPLPGNSLWGFIAGFQLAVILMYINALPTWNSTTFPIPFITQ